GRLLRPAQRGLAAEPRGDAAPGRGSPGAPAPDRAPARRLGRRRALRLPERSVGEAVGHAAVLPPDRVRHGRRGAWRDSPPQRAPPWDPRVRPRPGGARPPWAPLQRPRPRAVPVG